MLERQLHLPLDASEPGRPVRAPAPAREQAPERPAARREGPALSLAQCKRCRRSIRWAVTLAGKRMPLNAIPSQRGNVRINDAGRAEVLAGDRLELARACGDELWLPHFGSCSRRR